MGYPNPFISPLLSILRSANVELTDFSFNKDGASVGELSLVISIRKWRASVRIGLDSVTFNLVNPDWAMLPQLIPVFDAVSQRVREIVRLKPKAQETTFAFHVTAGTTDFGASTALLVNQSLLGESQFYGISLHRAGSALVIDRSLRYDGAAFVRIQRQLPEDATFSDVASRIYEDEVSALRLLGIADIV